VDVSNAIRIGRRLTGLVTDRLGATAERAGRDMLSDAHWDAIVRHLNLSGREHDIVRCAFDGMTQMATAHELGISTHTVHTHMERLYGKLDVHDRGEMLLRIFATYLALSREGVLTPADTPPNGSAVTSSR
jgi:DNA-binding CsgD family transcriptional regulator